MNQHTKTHLDTSDSENEKHLIFRNGGSNQEGLLETRKLSVSCTSEYLKNRNTLNNRKQTEYNIGAITIYVKCKKTSSPTHKDWRVPSLENPLIC